MLLIKAFGRHYPEAPHRSACLCSRLRYSAPDHRPAAKPMSCHLSLPNPLGNLKGGHSGWQTLASIWMPRDTQILSDRACGSRDRELETGQRMQAHGGSKVTASARRRRKERKRKWGRRKREREIAARAEVARAKATAVATRARASSRVCERETHSQMQRSWRTFLWICVFT